MKNPIMVRDLDPAVEMVILRCLEEEPENRPSSALIVSAALPFGEYLIAIYRPDDYDLSVETDEMDREIDVLNDQMVAAGPEQFLDVASFHHSTKVQIDRLRHLRVDSRRMRFFTLRSLVTVDVKRPGSSKIARSRRIADVDRVVPVGHYPPVGSRTPNGERMRRVTVGPVKEILPRQARRILDHRR